MSALLFPEDVLFQQRFLACGGFYKGKLDSIYGPKTDKAWKDFTLTTNRIRTRLGKFDPASERRIATLLPATQEMARRILAISKGVWLPEAKIEVRLTSGTRSYEEQARLYARGRTAPGNKVTNARPGSSWHNFACAVDVGIFVGGAYSGKAQYYDDLARQVLNDEHPEEWGGRWVSIKDRPHYQLTDGKSISQARKMFEEGKPFLPVITG